MSARGKSEPESMRSAFDSLESREELRSLGKSLREKCPRESHALWKPSKRRIDPIRLLEESSKGRMPHLLPLRYGRMRQSPFTFYRGTALNMASDLASTPVSGLRVQACGDAHLCNFGAYATPERRVIADINDLDETLPAPWEWDVKRLAASLVIASRDNGQSEADARATARACVRSYREHMDAYSRMRVLDIWYDAVDLDALIEMVRNDEARKRLKKRLKKARERCVVEHDFPELTTTDGGTPAIREHPPLIFHPPGEERAAVEPRVRRAFADYRESLSEDRRVLLDRYDLLDYAMKVVGIGSVGTFCCVLLLMASKKDPLFLQVKQARASVLEPYAGRSQFKNHGQRVVVGHRLMQAASDLFLGWTEGRHGMQFYVRQLKDMKLKPKVETYTPGVMRQYGEVCGRVLARAHARTGESAAISGYLGKNETFDRAIADFSVLYADQAERDHALLEKAIRAGRVRAAAESR